LLITSVCSVGRSQTYRWQPTLRKNLILVVNKKLARPI